MTGSEFSFFDRDLSWLSFNERVLMEAEKESVPLFERLNFLSIFSSNLDEFYRVRMPALAALHKLYQKQKLDEEIAGKHADVASSAKEIIYNQQNRFGKTLNLIIPELHEHGVVILYGKEIPSEIMPQVTHYFYTQVLAFLQPVNVSGKVNFFPENNKIYLAVTGRGQQEVDKLIILNIPTEHLSRFYTAEWEGKIYFVFLDDIIKAHLSVLPNIHIDGCYTFKVTRDAELNLNEEYGEDIAAKIEKQIEKRDYGLATRFLHEPGIPENILFEMINILALSEAMIVKGGRYHNLKDLSSITVNLPQLKYTKWPSLKHPNDIGPSLLDLAGKQDLLFHTPFHSYDAVLRFFNEAAISADVVHIYLTMYRVASDSRIVNALLSAANNGKKVTVLIELKARFDEANNLKWAKKLKKAGVQVIYTQENLKVHAKIALIKKRNGAETKFVGLLATGNLNEGTAKFYTDHLLMTGHQGMLKELESLFATFEGKSKAHKDVFKHLLVAQYNLQERFVELINREISYAKQGQPSGIIIKLNNLEERELISKLYEASNAGVRVQLIVRSICCLIPGVPNMSENITVRRIVDRYLEHGRVFLFYNNGANDLYLGSADWMNRNIYKRIEVCFPLYNESLKKEMLSFLNIQLNDNRQAVLINHQLQNVPIVENEIPIQSQHVIYSKIAGE